MPALICTEARTLVRESHITGTRAKRACSSARTRAAEATCRRVGACMCAQRGVEGGAKMELPWHRARGKQRSMRDAPVSGSSLYDFRLRASSARHDPQPPQAASHDMYPALPTLRAPPSYLRMMSAFWSWNSRKPSKIMSPCGHDSRGTTLGKERRGRVLKPSKGAAAPLQSRRACAASLGCGTIG